MVFKPVVKIEVETVSPDDPMDLRIYISNDSAISIHNVSMRASFNGQVHGMDFSDVSFIVRPDSVPKIEPGARPSVFEPFVAVHGEKLRTDDTAQIRVVVKFRASFTWWYSVRQRFYGIDRLEDGSLRWIEKPK